MANDANPIQTASFKNQCTQFARESLHPLQIRVFMVKRKRELKHIKQ